MEESKKFIAELLNKYVERDSHVLSKLDVRLVKIRMKNMYSELTSQDGIC